MLNFRCVLSHSSVLCGIPRVPLSVARAARNGAAVLVVVCLFASPAAAEVITFQDQPLGVYPDESVTIAAGGTSVRFTGFELQIRDIGESVFPPGASRVLSTRGDVFPISATFGPGFTTNFVQVRNWVFGGSTSEVDTIVMSAFDASRTLLGTVVSSSEFISVSFSGIAEVTFDDLREGEGYVLDEFTFGATPVPEPGSLLLACTAGAALLARRRRKTAREVEA